MAELGYLFSSIGKVNLLPIKNLKNEKPLPANGKAEASIILTLESHENHWSFLIIRKRTSVSASGSPVAGQRITGKIIKRNLENRFP